jgi:membrane protein required for colicin V production
MNQLDALLLVLLIPFVVRGYSLGFCRASMRLAGWVVGTMAAVKWYVPAGAELAARHFVEQPVASWVAGAGIFLGVCLPFYLLGRIADRVARALLLGGLNRVAGVAFGLVRGAVVLSLMLVSAQFLGQQFKLNAISEVIAASKLGRPLLNFATDVLHTAGDRMPPKDGKQA